MTPADGPLLLDKAIESLAGAEAEYAAGRFNNCANRCYYACFQAAIAALARAGVAPAGAQASWSHKFVIAQFDGLLIYRRKRYPTRIRGVLGSTYELRRTADYRAEPVSRADAARALERASEFVATVNEEGPRR